MAKIKLFIVFVFSFFLFLTKSNAQSTNLNSFSIKSNFRTTLNADFIDTVGKFNSNEFSLGFNLPVYNHYFKNRVGKTAFYGFSFQNNNTIIYNHIGFLAANNDLYNISFGLRALYFTGNKNIWLTKISSNFFEDEFSISNPKPRFSGVFLFNRMVNRRFNYHLGLSYKYSFGYAAILPVAGLKYQFADKWKLIVFLPFHISTQYKVNDKLWFDAKFNASGAISYYTNKNNLFGQSKEEMLFRKRANVFAINAKYRLNSNLLLNASIGREGNRTIYFSDIKSEINKEPVNYFKSKIQSNLFINIGFAFKFGKKKNSIDFDNDTIDYIEELTE